MFHETDFLYKSLITVFKSASMLPLPQVGLQVAVQGLDLLAADEARKLFSLVKTNHRNMFGQLLKKKKNIKLNWLNFFFGGNLLRKLSYFWNF